MYIEPSKYTELIEEIRSLKNINETLSYENKVFQNQLKIQKQQKEKAVKDYEQMKQILQTQTKYLLQKSEKQSLKITQEYQRQIQTQKLFLSKKFIDDEKSSYAKLKKLQLQFKDLRLKSYRNDQFVSKIQRINGHQNNTALQQLEQWVKKLAIKKEKTNKSMLNIQSVKSIPKRPEKVC